MLTHVREGNDPTFVSLKFQKKRNRMRLKKKVFKETMDKKYSNLPKGINLEIQETELIPNRLNPKNVR